ncbi:hypothetical protein SMICM304S_07559 [Streptomyces microflavus]
MIARSAPGSLITMASGAVDSASAGLLCYSAAKAAVVQLTKTLATELGPHAIRVNAVAPGWIRTPMTDRHGAEQQQRAEATMARISPLGRVGEPEDVAHTVLHLGLRRLGLHHRPDPPPERRRRHALVSPATSLPRPHARSPPLRSHSGSRPRP